MSPFSTQTSLPPSAERTFEAAARFFQEGKLAECEALCRGLLEANADDAPATNLLGQIALKVKKPELAAQLFTRACELSPQQPAAFFNLGQAYGDLKRHADAVKAYRRAVELSPGMVVALLGLGMSLGRLKKHEEALQVLQKAAELAPENGQIQFSRGWSLKELSRMEEAESAFVRAAELEPNNGTAHYAVASVRARRGDSEGSLVACKRAIELDLAQLDWQTDYASGLRQVGRVDEALQYTRALVEAHSDVPAPRGLLGILLLLSGQWSEGWEAYEWRWKCASFTTRWRKFREPLWDGGDLAGKRILLWPEQGRGDVIQFVRYAPLVAQRGGRVIVSVSPELVTLLKSMEGLEMAVADSGAIPPFDVHLPMLSLPRIFGTTIDNVPNSVPYLRPAATVLEKWRQRIASEKSGPSPSLRVGLVWAGGPKHVDDALRSMPLADLAPLADVSGVRFYSLQKGPRSKEKRPAGLNLIDYTEDLRDYSDTAALIAQLDLTISVDTSVCHLAGAIGKPIWTLIAFSPDWRWMLNRQDTVWYPTMRLFRQSRLRDWSEVIERVVRALEELRDTKSASA